MHEREEPATQYAWIVYAVAVVMFGGLAGYVASLQSARVPVSASTTTPAASATGTVLDESQLRAYRDILARDSKNATAAAGAGNLLYDAQRYHEAIGFYSQAFAINPSDINVSTDLGTAIWYSGRADEALAQYDRSLAINPTHAQTLFNVGIVRADGKHDYAGAIAAWDALLKTNPDYPAAERVRSLIADARTKL